MENIDIPSDPAGARLALAALAGAKERIAMAECACCALLLEEFLAGAPEGFRVKFGWSGVVHLTLSCAPLVPESVSPEFGLPARPRWADELLSEARAALLSKTLEKAGAASPKELPIAEREILRGRIAEADRAAERLLGPLQALAEQALAIVEPCSLALIQHASCLGSAELGAGASAREILLAFGMQSCAALLEQAQISSCSAAGAAPGQSPKI